jgi:hypothetical protein
MLVPLVLGLILGMIIGLIIGLVAGLVGGLGGGLVVWLRGWRDSGALEHLLHLRPNESIRRSARKALVSRLVVWLIVGLGVGLGVGLAFRLSEEMGGGLVCGLVCGLFLGTGTDESDQIELRTALYFSRSYGVPSFALRTRKLSLSWKDLVALLVIVLFAGLVTGLIGALIHGLNMALVEGLIGALIGGLIGALGLFDDSMRRHYATRFLLSSTGAMPLRYVRFLDEAAGRLLLLKVGGGYVFVHRLVQEYLANLGKLPQAGPGAEAGG